MVLHQQAGATLGRMPTTRRRHTITETGIVVVTKEDEPFTVDVSEEALQHEAEFDRRGAEA